MDARNFGFVFDNSYASALEGAYTPWRGESFPAPHMVAFNRALARELGLSDTLDSPEGAAVLCGSVTPAGAEPLAQAYAGHQFGGFVPQLGDGRALLLGEILDRQGRRRDLHLKGAGRTPYSRGGDGRAALGPVLREYLMGEAMHALGIPTTRALAAVVTGETIARERPEPGAVLARVAASHLRIGTFQYFAARREHEHLRRLADYAIARHDPDLSGEDDRYLAFLDRVVERQSALVAKWMHVGFVHGVMNTDNTTISGETLDFGPCAFMDRYALGTVFSSIDHQGRYAYGNQPAILQWNLARLAEALLPLIDPEDTDRAVRRATETIESMQPRYEAVWLAGMRCKIGLATEEEGDAGLVGGMLRMLEGQGVDYTQFFRRLADAAAGDASGLKALFDDASVLRPWLDAWRARMAREPRPPAQRKAAMDRVNPLYIPRNHQVEAALEAAVQNGDPAPFQRLLDVLSDPFAKQEGQEAYELPAPPEFGAYRTFCGT